MQGPPVRHREAQSGSKWRQIIWSLSSLWDDCRIRIPPPNNDDLGVIQLFSLHVKNAGNRLLSITIEQKDYTMSPTVSLPLFYLVFVEYSERIRSLYLRSINQTTWNTLSTFSCYSSFPHLDSFSLEFALEVSLGGLASLRSRFPRLQKLKLAGPPYGIHSGFHLHRLTALTFDTVHPDYALHILSHCPNLVRFEVCDASRAILSPESLPNLVLNHEIVLPHLIDFTWKQITCPSAPASIHRIRLPVIRHLTWHWFCEELTNSEWTQWKQFFHHFRNLETLDVLIDAKDGSDEILDELLFPFSTQPIR